MNKARLQPATMACMAALLTLSATSSWALFWDRHSWITEEMNFELPASGIERLAIKTHNGYIDAIGWTDADRIQVQVTIKAGGWNRREAERCMDAIEIVTDVRGDDQLLTWKWEGRHKVSWRTRISFEVKLPMDMELSAVTHNGHVYLNHLEADAVLRSHNGAIEAQDQRGDLKVSTHNGRIKVEEHHGDLEVRSHNGRIDVEAVTTLVNLKTHNGRIQGDFTGSEEIDGKVITHNGSISVTLGDEASTEISCSSRNISVTSKVDVHSKTKRSLKGTVGRGEGDLTLSTHNGSIRIR